MPASCSSVFRFAFAFLCVLAPVWGGDLTKPYFTATKQGSWAEYLLASPDGSKSSYSYERGADDAGRAVIVMKCKVLAGTGKGAASKLTYILPRAFNLEREGLNYGKFTEKMLMDSGGAEVLVDERTLETIRQCTKDFTGAVTFEAAEKIGGRMCDRYSYSAKSGGPNPTIETGTLWLDPSVPFAIVRQSSKVANKDGTPVSQFDMTLQETGLNQLIAEAAATPTPPETKQAPSKVTLADGFKTGRVGMDIGVVPGSSGRSLHLTLVNKTDAELTVTVPAGELEFEVDSPVHTLKITTHKAAGLVLPANEKADPLTVDQRGTRGITEGHCSLSVYEGTPLFSGSVTMGTFPK